MFEKIRKAARRIAVLGAGNCPRCGAPLTAAGNCPSQCGGA